MRLTIYAGSHTRIYQYFFGTAVVFNINLTFDCICGVILLYCLRIGTQSLSVDPDFQPNEITPIFISQNTCTCPLPPPTSANVESKEKPVHTDSNCPLLPNSQSYAMTPMPNPNNQTHVPTPTQSTRYCGPPIPTSVHHAYK